MQQSTFLNTDEIFYYLKDLKKIPVLSNDRLKEIIKDLKDEMLTESKRSGLLKELVIGNLRFVISVAKQYQNQGMDLPDLISEGNVGLIRAAKEFDPTKKVRFISYAVWWIKQSIMASLNDNARTIRLPSNIIQDLQKLKKEPLSEDGAQTHTKKGSLSLPYCVSLSDKINEEGDQLVDIVVNHNADNPQQFLEDEEGRKAHVRKALNVLNDKEKIIITKYFGLDGVECNLEDLGEEFGCTKERIRQLKEKAMKKLRNESFILLKYL